MEIMPKVHLIPDVIANPYLIVDTDGLTLIDTGLPGSDKKILGYLSDRGYRARDLTRIILTHSDVDHVGSLAKIQRATDARVLTSKIEAEAIEKGVPSRRIKPASLRRRVVMGLIGRFFKATPVHIDEVLHDGQILPVLAGLQVIATPGHTPGHISLYSPTAGILFAGDSVVSRDSRLLNSLPANTWDKEQARISFRKQSELGASVVCSGHGPVVQAAAGKWMDP